MGTLGKRVGSMYSVMETNRGAVVGGLSWAAWSVDEELGDAWLRENILEVLPLVDGRDDASCGGRFIGPGMAGSGLGAAGAQGSKMIDGL